MEGILDAILYAAHNTMAEIYPLLIKLLFTHKGILLAMQIRAADAANPPFFLMALIWKLGAVAQKPLSKIEQMASQSRAATKNGPCSNVLKHLKRFSNQNVFF